MICFSENNVYMLSHLNNEQQYINVLKENKILTIGIDNIDEMLDNNNRIIDNTNQINIYLSQLINAGVELAKNTTLIDKIKKMYDRTIIIINKYKKMHLYAITNYEEKFINEMREHDNNIDKVIITAKTSAINAAKSAHIAKLANIQAHNIMNAAKIDKINAYWFLIEVYNDAKLSMLESQNAFIIARNISRNASRYASYCFTIVY